MPIKTIGLVRIECSSDGDYFKMIDIINPTMANLILSQLQARETAGLSANNAMSKITGTLTQAINMSKKDLTNFMIFCLDRSFLQRKQMIDVYSTGKPISIELHTNPPKVTFISGGKLVNVKVEDQVKKLFKDLLDELKYSAFGFEKQDFSKYRK